jgi:hypothetical protein
MIELAIIGISLKAAALLGLAFTLATAILTGCAKKNQCNTCTVVTTNSVSGESTKIYNQSDDGDCEMSLEEYKADIDVTEDLKDLNTELQDFSGNTTQTHITTCTKE